MRMRNSSAQVAGLRMTEALRTHAHGFAHDAFPKPNNSDKLFCGCSYAALTSHARRIGIDSRSSFLYDYTRDRRNICRRPSRAFSQSASSPLLQLAHSLPKKSLLWSSRFSPSPLPANTDTLSERSSERAKLPAPNNLLRFPCDPAGKPC